MTVAERPQLFNLHAGFGERETREMIVAALDQGCSDIKVQSNDYVTVYWRRQWFPLSTRTLEDTEAKRILTLLGGPSTIPKIGSGGEVDDDPEFFRPDRDRVLVRLRLHAIAARVGGEKNGVSITLRTIPEELPELSKQSLPEGLAEELIMDKGLLLINGATGSGKTTLITALLHERTKECPAPSIQTFEDPIEMSYAQAGLGNGPLVCQAGIGKHLADWSRAAPSAMRSKPDILLMGEIRDAMTADKAMEMAVTGHHVLATIHADTPNETMFRLVEMFPAEGRSAAAAKLLGALRIICSRKIIRLDVGMPVALTAWIIFDSKIKDDLQSEAWPYPRWARYVKEHIESRGQDFASQCNPYIRSGAMGVKLFRETTGMGKQEAEQYFEKVRG